MATEKQKQAARENIKKAQAKWKSMTKRQRALAQPQGRARKKPGTGGSGKFFRVEVRPKSQFTSFRVHDVGEKGGLQRLAGRRRSGSWATHAWLIEKDTAHRQGDTLVIDDPKTQTVLDSISGSIEHVVGDIFKAHPRKNVPEKDKPTPAQKKAWAQNIKKAQETRTGK